jgi:three-Cys-motif partner protein
MNLLGKYWEGPVNVKGTIWKIKPHTLAKHEILRRYLGAWFPILATYNGRIIYLDGFCGPGRYKGGEDGSPVIALKEAMKHNTRFTNREVTFLFIDSDKRRIEHLKLELASLPIPANFSVIPTHDQFDNTLKGIFDDLAKQGANLAPTFAFVDPFGFKGIPFDLVERLLKNPKTEVFINMMVDSINRFIEHPDPVIQRQIIDLFGTHQVIDVIRSSEDRITELRLLYQSQLCKHVRFVRYFEMRDENNRLIYYLFFATNHPLGHEKMKEAFWKVDTSSGFRFSDLTDPSQLILFDLDTSDLLANELMNKFTGQNTSVGNVLKYILDETPYTSKHKTKALRLLEEQNKITVDDYKNDGNRRRPGTFPKNVNIHFT